MLKWRPCFENTTNRSNFLSFVLCVQNYCCLLIKTDLFVIYSAYSVFHAVNSFIVHRCPLGISLLEASFFLANLNMPFLVLLKCVIYLLTFISFVWVSSTPSISAVELFESKRQIQTDKYDINYQMFLLSCYALRVPDMQAFCSLFSSPVSAYYRAADRGQSFINHCLVC